MAIYIKFDGVDGEVQDKDHKQWTEIESFSFGSHTPLAQGSTGSGRRRGAVEVSDMQISKVVDKAGPKLLEHVFNGKVFPKVTLHSTASYTDAGRVTYLAVEMEHVLVSSYNVSGGGGALPSEVASLNFEKIKVTYTENDEKGKKKGTVETTWDVQAGKK